MGIVIKSASYAPSDAARDADTRRAVEAAGYELPEETLPPLPALDQNGTPTPAEQQKNVEDYGRQVAACKAKYGETAWNEAVNREIVIGTGTQLACLEHENGAEITWCGNLAPRRLWCKHPDGLDGKIIVDKLAATP